MIKFKSTQSKVAEYLKTSLENDQFNNEIKNDFTIRWGYSFNDKDSGVVLNTRDAIKNANDKENILLTLRENHIRAPRIIKPGKKTDFPILGRKFRHESGNDINVIDSLDECITGNYDYYVRYLKLNREFLVHVMNLKVIYIEEKYTDELEYNDLIIRTQAYNYNLKRIDLDDFNSRTKEAIESLAVKAIHALGLDFGVVNIGLAENNRYYAIDVDATCKNANEECLNVYVEEFKKYIKILDDVMLNKVEVSIGADPECLLKDKNTNQLVLASQIVKDGYSIGYDDRSIEASKVDHPVLELRPNFSDNPNEVYESVKSLLITLSNDINYKNVGIYGGSVPLFNYWVGGHIHFGMKPNAKLIKALDNYLALPIMMIEKSSTARQRNSKYGLLGNFRHKNHGGFEYCTLSSWLVSPKVTKGVLCLSKIVVQEHMNLPKIYIKNYEDIRSYYNIKKEVFRESIEEIMLEIMKTETYKTYQEEVDYIFRMIENEHEWDEDKDIRETWNLESSVDEYNIKKACYIPRRTRNKFGIKIGDKINIEVGRTQLYLDVYPKDDSSAFKNGFIKFTSDVHYKLSLLQNHEISIFKYDRNDKFKAGPVMAIICDKEENYVGQFGMQTNLFRKMLKIAKGKGMLAYVTTIDSFNWDKQLVKGHCYDFEKDTWYKDYFPLPDVIYERGLNICKFNYGKLATEFLEYIDYYNIKFINEPKAIDIISSKWDTTTLLNSNEKTKKYIPETVEFTNSNFKYMINKYETNYIKLNDGYGGAGIFCIVKLEDDKFKVIHKNPDGDNHKENVLKDDLLPTIRDMIESEDYSVGHYIIQQGIKFIEHNGKGFELRALMLKNGEGKWMRTAIVGRIRGTTREFINYWDGFDLSSRIIRENLAEHESLIRSKINTLTKQVTTVIDESNLHMGEVAIDIGIDKDLNLYIIELNSKPDNLLTYIGAYKRRSLALSRIIEYGKYLASE